MEQYEEFSQGTDGLIPDARLMGVEAALWAHTPEDPGPEPEPAEPIRWEDCDEWPSIPF